MKIFIISFLRMGIDSTILTLTIARLCPCASTPSNGFSGKLFFLNSNDIAGSIYQNNILLPILLEHSQLLTRTEPLNGISQFTLTPSTCPNWPAQLAQEAVNVVQRCRICPIYMFTGKRGKQPEAYVNHSVADYAIIPFLY